MVENPNPQDESNQNVTEAPAAEGHQEIRQILDLVREQGQPVLIGIAVAVAIFLGYGAYRNYKHSSELKASQLMLSARSPEQLQQVVSEYPSSSVAPVALLTLAGQYFDAGQYDMAQFTYGQFDQKYPNHPMKAVTELGKAQCLEAAGQAEQALAAFSAFTNAHPDHFMAPMALFGKARCLTQLGRFAEAKAVYEDFMAAHPKSGWTPVADTALLFVDKERRAQESKGMSAGNQPVAAPAAVIPPAATAGSNVPASVMFPPSSPSAAKP